LVLAHLFLVLILPHEYFLIGTSLFSPLDFFNGWFTLIPTIIKFINILIKQVRLDKSLSHII